MGFYFYNAGYGFMNGFMSGLYTAMAFQSIRSYANHTPKSTPKYTIDNNCGCETNYYNSEPYYDYSLSYSNYGCGCYGGGYDYSASCYNYSNYSNYSSCSIFPNYSVYSSRSYSGYYDYGNYNINKNYGMGGIKSGSDPSGSEYKDKASIIKLISELSSKYDVDERLINAIVEQESSYNPKEKSKAGAMGLMQLMPGTAKDLKVTNPYDPYQNLDGGIRYFKKMLDMFNNDISLALAAYNAGPQRVKDCGNNIPNIPETQEYVEKIMKNYKKKCEGG